MKKVVFGALLLLMSLGASAATVTISNPVFVPASGVITSISSTNDVDEASSTIAVAMTKGEAYSASWNVSFSNDVSATLYGSVFPDIGSFAKNWSMAIYDASAALIASLDAATVVKTQLDNLLLSANTLYKVIINGVAPKNQFNTGIALETTDMAAIPGVPLPAAVWLFGSVLLGGFGVSRRRRAKQNSSAMAIAA